MKHSRLAIISLINVGSQKMYFDLGLLWLLYNTVSFVYLFACNSQK